MRSTPSRAAQVARLALATAACAMALVPTASGAVPWQAASAPDAKTPTRHLIVTSSTGRITSKPKGIDCKPPTGRQRRSPGCQADFPKGTAVTLTYKQTDPGVTIGSWSTPPCAVNAKNQCVVSMTKDWGVRVGFARIYTLTVVKAGTGGGTITSSPAAIACGATCSARLVAVGDPILLTPVLDAGTTAVSWSGCTETQPETPGGPTRCQLTPTGDDVTVTATFSAGG